MATYSEIKRMIEPKQPKPVLVWLSKTANPPKKVQAMMLWLKGLTYSEIGAQLGFSRQYAQQIVAPPKFVRDAVKARAKSHCEECKVLLAYGHIHHKQTIGRRIDNFNDVDNLQYLCIACHRTKHC